MEHIHSQLVIHQRQQYAQLHALATGSTPDPLTPAFLGGDQQQVVEFQTEASGYLDGLTLNGENQQLNQKALPGTLVPLEMQKDGDASTADGSETAEEKDNEDPLLDGRKRKFEVPLSDETGEEDQESDADDQESGMIPDRISFKLLFYCLELYKFHYYYYYWTNRFVKKVDHVNHNWSI